MAMEENQRWQNSTEHLPNGWHRVIDKNMIKKDWHVLVKKIIE